MNRISRMLLLAAAVTSVMAPFAWAAEQERYIVILKRYSGPPPEVKSLGGTWRSRTAED